MAKDTPEIRDKAKRDLVVVVVCLVAVFLIGGYLDLREALFEFFDRYEEYELDEIFLSAALSFLAFAWYAYRRWRDYASQLAASVEINKRLNEEVAERLRLAKAMAAARDEAVRAARVKSEFLTMMSHELRTPLNAIIGFSDMMRAEAFGPLGDQRYAGYVTDIRDSGSHLLSLINDILDISKIETGEADLQSEDVDVEHVIRSCLTLVHPLAETAEIAIITEVPADLPRLFVDERKLKQIVVNLLSNAVKFTPAGGQVEVAVWVPPGDGHHIRVTDTGIGIAAEDIATALAPFRQIDGSLSRKYDGTGLGLPLAVSLAELHGGSLALHSEPGEGTSVTVRFPADRIVQAEATALADTRPVHDVA